MCLIIHNPEGKPLDKDKINAAYENNKDGFGVMWNEDGKVNIIKGLFAFDDIWTTLELLSGLNYAVHFRYRTEGSISESQCHPHLILDRDRHGSDLYLMHNGTLKGFAHKDKSDSKMFALMLQKRVFEEKHKALDIVSHPGFSSRIAKVIGKHNKLLFMGSDGNVTIVNKEEGIEINGCWYSNTYSLVTKDKRHIGKFRRKITDKIYVPESSFSRYVSKSTYSNNYTDWLGRYYQTERKTV